MSAKYLTTSSQLARLMVGCILAGIGIAAAYFGHHDFGAVALLLGAVTLP